MNNDKELDWPTTDPSSHQTAHPMTTKLRKFQTQNRAHNVMRFAHDPPWGGSTPRWINCMTGSCRVTCIHYSKVTQVVTKTVGPGELNRYSNKPITGQEPERRDVCFRNRVQICSKVNSASHPVGRVNKAICA
jgi:hypothetical protein